MRRLAAPRSDLPRLNAVHTFLIVSLHVFGLLGLWFLPRPVDIALFLSTYLVTCLGVGVGYHRLLTHRGYVCGRWLRRLLTWMG